MVINSESRFSESLKEIAVKETISAGSSHTVGLKSDGTVVAVGNNENGHFEVSNLKNIKLPEKT